MVMEKLSLNVSQFRITCVEKFVNPKMSPKARIKTNKKHTLSALRKIHVAISTCTIKFYVTVLKDSR